MLREACLPLVCLWRGGRIPRVTSEVCGGVGGGGSPEESLRALVRAVYQLQAHDAELSWRENSAVYLESFSNQCVEAWSFEEKQLLPMLAELGLSWRFLSALMYSEHRLIAQKTASFGVALLNAEQLPNASRTSLSNVFSELNGLERTF